MKSILLIILTLTLGFTAAAQDSTRPKAITLDGVNYDLTPKIYNTVYPYSIELKNAEGEIVPSSKVFSKGKRPVVLVFWLTTCVPCQYELRALHKKYAEWKEIADFDLYAISMDFERREESVYRKIESAGWKWETYYDYKRNFIEVMPGRLNGMPQTFIIDKDGEIAYHKRKYKMGDEDVLFEKIIDLQ